MIPHGIYDMMANQGYVSIGSSSEADFIIDNLFWWWSNYGIHQYPEAENIVVRLNLKEYKKGIKVDKKEIDQNRISFHPQIPELNYRIYP